VAVFGGRSIRNLAEAHPDIQRVMNAAIADFDFMVLQSSRTQEEQEADFAKGVTKAHWKESAHDFPVSYAVDCAPFPLDWKDIAEFARMSQVILGHADQLGVHLTWGGSWTSIKDYPHFEITNWRMLARASALIS
jgi:peptidoglycan L-alanyl-D-glutamate endopeptidase CwlK